MNISMCKNKSCLWVIVHRHLELTYWQLRMVGQYVVKREHHTLAAMS